MKTLERNVKNFIKNLPPYTKKVNLILLGNSIIAGYRRRGEIQKLFSKNNMCEQIKKIFNKYNIAINIFDFSKVQDNGNRRIFELMIKNVDLNTMDILYKKDVEYLQRLNHDSSYISNEAFYHAKNPHINDLFNNTQADTYTMILFGGCTGRLLETFFKENFPKNLRIFNAFKEDLKYLSEILDYILFINPNIPVFISGLPKIKCLKPLIYFFNKKIENLCKDKFNAIYFNFGEKNLKYIHDGEIFFDFHPDPDESCRLINNFFNISKNFINVYYIASKYYIALRTFNLYQYDKIFPEMENTKLYRNLLTYFDEKTIQKGKSFFYKKGYLPQKHNDFHGIKIRPN